MDEMNYVSALELEITEKYHEIIIGRRRMVVLAGLLREAAEYIPSDANTRGLRARIGAALAEGGSE